MLTATHVNSYSRVAQKGAMKGKTMRIHVYGVTGTAKDVVAYNEAMEKAASERGAKANRDEAGNCLFQQITNWQTGNVAKNQLPASSLLALAPLSEAAFSIASL